MYQIEAWSALRTMRREPRAHSRVFAVSGNVLALGVTSLLTDVSSEMVTTVLPVYLVLHLGLSPGYFGVVDGMYHGVTALLRLASGVAADRFRRHKEVAAFGYAVSAASRLALAAASGTGSLVVAAVAVDRVGKGVRTAPRDALISLSTPAQHRGTAFGVHRALDSAGAMLGPLTALAILMASPQAFDVVFVSSFSIAVCGLGALLLFVTNVDTNDAARVSPPLRLAGIFRYRGLGAVTVAASALSLATFGDGFLYLMLQQRAGFNAGLFPLLYVGSAACYLVLAVPAGRVADRIGRRTMFLAGYFLLAALYLLTLRVGASSLAVGACVLMLGAHYAMTDGVLMALASTKLPADRQGSGLAALTTCTSVARLFASVLFGALWSAFGMNVAVVTFFIGLVAALAIAALALKAGEAWSYDDATQRQ